ncbi:hypothetical protein Ancab_021816 [Ancistrocladus abbreviatus]
MGNYNPFLYPLFTLICISRATVTPASSATLTGVVSKDQITCTMCDSCDDPCQPLLSPPPPSLPPPEASGCPPSPALPPPPPVPPVYSPPSCYTCGNSPPSVPSFSYSSPPPPVGGGSVGGGTYGSTPPPPNPILPYFPYYYYPPPVGSSGDYSKIRPPLCHFVSKLETRNFAFADRRPNKGWQATLWMAVGW